mmetsp:Transcript_61530/g.172149  ORF Transcript_61530/g.172149 Transcript_61530/m.172149 type:complete len:204 (-) Transcript_61530:950-1561(-)
MAPGFWADLLFGDVRGFGCVDGGIADGGAARDTPGGLARNPPRHSCGCARGEGTLTSGAKAAAATDGKVAGASGSLAMRSGFAALSSTSWRMRLSSVGAASSTGAATGEASASSPDEDSATTEVSRSSEDSLLPPGPGQVVPSSESEALRRIFGCASSTTTGIGSSASASASASQIAKGCESSTGSMGVGSFVQQRMWRWNDS